METDAIKKEGNRYAGKKGKQKEATASRTKGIRHGRAG